MTKIPYVTFMKHAQKVTKSASAGRPVLKGVIHRDNYVAVTDSHRLYFASDMYEGEEKNIDPKTGAEITEGNYPEIIRLLPDENDAKVSARLNVDRTAKALKLIEQAGKIEKLSDMVVIESDGSTLLFKTGEESAVYCEYPSEYGIEGDSFIMYASAKYLSEGMAFIKDAGFEEATFNFFGNMRSFTITAGNLTVLILPIRKGLTKEAD